ncbi:hypothetical protein BDN72DRAFT_283561 [Pluteus cervinus]|uniref:Uncharacterized protein n=1 Tax=Pluteus cervinus TaxID=181527 RepID=A0ACD3B582_9AGAR|nr:hypothetical protein BDN72DRAFT_283561 [Pluteus cervinus]
MPTFHKFLTTILLAVTYADASSRYATHRRRDIGPGVTLETYHPPTIYETYGDGMDHPAAKSASGSDGIEEAAISFVQSHLGVDQASVSFKSGFTGEAASHAYVKQAHNGIPFANAVANVAFNKADKVVAFGSSFVKPRSISGSQPTISVSRATQIAEEALNGKFNEKSPTLEYFAKEDGTAVLTHVIEIQSEDTGAWYEAFVDAHSGELVSVTDFVSSATWRVVPIWKQSILEGLELLVDPEDLLASPNAWLSNSTNIKTTSGNNAITYIGNSQGNVTTQSTTNTFDYLYNIGGEPAASPNPDCARVNAFYVVNTVHDFTYRYGFTEPAFNFQVNNFGKGGSANDPVLVQLQSTAGTNNANFATPPDGSPGQLRMYLWTYTTPRRDSALENDIVVHEMTHGVTNRMTGGGTARCLQTTEAGGMGEGWGDALADWTEKTSAAVPDYVMGQYVIGDAGGIRTHPYSTNATINPLRYSSIAALNEVHNIGEVWANMLHNVYAALVTAHGWSATSRTNPDGSEGNIVWLHLFIDALALQPCNPTFVQARDAWIQADANRYGGVNRCILWRTFASKGLGQGAANFRDSTTIPADC